MTEGRAEHDSATPQRFEADLSCRSCGAPREELVPLFSEEGQYMWSTCRECGADHLPNGLVRI